jgi:uncharacterized protein YkwD
MAQQLAFLFVSDPGQKRQHPKCNRKLTDAATYRAQDMANNKYFNHFDQKGHSPNYWAEVFGCQLPSYYPKDGNQIESIGLNYTSANAAWAGWKNSPAHRTHVLGLDPFWAEQTSYGFGYAESEYGRIYVVLTSPGCNG